jgi:hypothetical protein
MSESGDEDARLTILLRTIQFPEPLPDFLAGARRRYVKAIEARYRREAVTGLLVASVALGLATTLLLSAVEPAALIGWVAVAMADLAKWVDGIGIVVGQVPPIAWTTAVLVSVVSLLSVASLRRVRSPVTVK